MKKLFTSDRFFQIVTIMGVVGAAIGALYYCIPMFETFDLSAAFILAFQCPCTLCLYISYKKHDKNIMKGMLAALLTNMLINPVCWLDTTYVLDFVFGIISIVLNLSLFINHFIINAQHHSMPLNIRINQLIVLLDFVLYVVWDFAWIFTNPFGVSTIGAVVEIVGTVGIMSTIVCVESRLDAYRINREACGWTEEKGYPDGYVHEYERNKS